MSSYIKTAHQCFRILDVKSSTAKSKFRWYTSSATAPPKTYRRSMPKIKPDKTYKTPHAVLLVVPAAAFALGTWQIQRKIQKENEIEELQRISQLEPVDFPKDLGKLKDMEFQRVKVRGTFNHSHEIFFGPKSNLAKKRHKYETSSFFSTSSAGYWIFTPFKLSDRDLTILVNRGWVPANKKLPTKRLSGQINEEVEIVGYVRNSQKRKPLGSKNVPEKNFWTYRDLDKMSEITGAYPISIDADEHSTVPGGPLGGQINVNLENNHLGYIITWYSLCAATLYMWFKFHKSAPTPASSTKNVLRPF